MQLPHNDMPAAAMGSSSLSNGSRRLSERRGIPELQPLEPTSAPKISSFGKIATDPAENGPQSYDSSTSSDMFSPDLFGTPTISSPATPVDTSPLKSLASSLELTSSAVSSIREEDERSECRCSVCEDLGHNLVNGLGLSVDDLAREDLNMEFPKRLDVAGPDSPATLMGSALEQNYQNDEKLAPFVLPPTPPLRAGERPFPYTAPTSPTETSQDLIDHEAFSAGPPSLPQSPTTDSSRSRAATILNRVVPAKLRASIKRRMSSPNNNLTQPPPPPLPSVTTMPMYPGARTPPAESNDGFDMFPSTFLGPRMATEDYYRAVDDYPSALSSPEGTLPPMMSSCPSLTTESISGLPSPCLSGREMAGFPGIRTESIAEISRPELELFTSPLHPPTISPQTSPSLTSTSDISLVTGTPSLQTSHKKIPSIDPATPNAPKKLSMPITLVTANSLADMIEEMNTDLAAYDATRVRMIESGWSSPQEIKNVELQRKEKEQTWKIRINESKKILEGMRRGEVKPSAVSSVSSVQSLDTFPSRMTPTLNSILPLSVGPFGSTSSERTTLRET